MEEKMNSEWWKGAVIYQIYPRSFCDSNNDGTGDIRGIIEKIPYLVSLGVTAVWLSPVYRSPMDDFGYDVKDYRLIDPVFGSNQDFFDLIRICHENGIKVIKDMVLNHTSDLHYWFVQSRSSRKSRKRDWYIWHPGKGKGKHYPNNWRAAFGGRAWEYDTHTGEYYLHSFLKEQPDLNWRNHELRKAVYHELKFWLDHGVDGFRLDVINWLVKDEFYRNNSYGKFVSPRLYDLQNHVYDRNRPETHEIIKELRSLVDSYGDRMLVGEVFSLPPGDQELSASYLGNGNDELHLAFDFSLIYTKWSAKAFYRKLSTWMELIPANGWPCIVLSNHDQSRAASRYSKRGETVERMKILAALLLTVKGTPFIYYGEELGMENVVLSRKDIRDPLGKKYWPFFCGRDLSRGPMQWNTSRYAGFSKVKPWLPVHPGYAACNIEKQDTTPDSLLNFYRRLIYLHRHEQALRDGDLIFIQEGNDDLLGYTRKYKNEEIIVLLNFSGYTRIVTVAHEYHSLMTDNENETFGAGKVSLKRYGILAAKRSLII